MVHPPTADSAPGGGCARHILILLVLYLSFSLPALWTRTLWSPDEARYAQVSGEMVQRGDFILPHLNGEVYYEKPPLYFWLIALVGSAGLRDLTPRLISLLSGGGVIILTYLLGRGLFSAGTGFHAALILSTSLLFCVLSQTGIIDMTFNLLVLLAIFSYWRSLTAEESAPAWHMLLYISAGLAVLAKGPVGLIVPLLVIISHSLAGRTFRKALKEHLIWGVILSLVVVGLWFVPAVGRGGEDYFNTMIFKQSVGRAINSWSNRHPFYYYLYNFPLYFLPWSFFLPGAIACGLKGWSKGGRGDRFALLWLLVVFIFFSAASGKRERYIFPLYPAAALLMAAYLGELGRAVSSGRRRAFLPSHIFFSLWGVAGVAILIFVLKYPSIQGTFRQGGGFERYASPIFLGTISWFWPVFSVSVLIVGGVGLLNSLRRDLVGIRVSTIAVMAIMMITFHLVIAPAVEGNKSARGLALRVAEQVREGSDLKVRGNIYDPSLNYYTGIIPIGLVRSFPEIPREMSGEREVFLLLPAGEYQKMLNGGGKPYNLIFSDRLFGRDVVLISNQKRGGGG